MFKKISSFVVRFAALVSFFGLVTGFQSNDMDLKWMEVVMILIWLQMDFKLIYSFFRKK